MFGNGILKGLSVTAKRFWNTYWEDTVWFFRRLTGGKKRYYTPEGIARRSSKDARGIFTIQYPEEKLPSPEEFRYIPFLVYDETESGEKAVRCTSCGICAKVCPPQCIWIVRTNDPQPLSFKHNPIGPLSLRGALVANNCNDYNDSSLRHLLSKRLDWTSAQPFWRLHSSRSNLPNVNPSHGLDRSGSR